MSSVLWYQIKLPRILEDYDIEVFWGTQNVLPIVKKKGISYVLTVHDLVYYECPETMKTKNRIASSVLLRKSISKADKIIAVSKSTRDGIIKKFGDETRNKIEVIYESAREFNIDRNTVDLLRDKYKMFINEKYILYLGTIEPRKNIDTLLDAFEMIRKSQKCKLVLGGKMGWKSNKTYKKMQNHKYKEDIIYLGYISDDEKYFLMKECLVFVFPSIYEGFGLPVVETMKCESIAVVANNSSLKELIERKELLFDTLDSNDLALTILRLINEEKLYMELKEYCVNRGRSFSWQVAAEMHKKVLISKEVDK